MNFTKRAECVDYLVANGAHRGMAAAAIDQYCNYDSNGATDDAIRRGLDDCDESCISTGDVNDDGFVACIVDEAFVISVYRTAADMMTIWGGLIYFDNEPIYLENGNILPLAILQTSDMDETERAALEYAHYVNTRSLHYS